MAPNAEIATAPYGVTPFGTMRSSALGAVRHLTLSWECAPFLPECRDDPKKGSPRDASLVESGIPGADSYSVAIPDYSPASNASLLAVFAMRLIIHSIAACGGICWSPRRNV